MLIGVLAILKFFWDLYVLSNSDVDSAEAVPTQVETASASLYLLRLLYQYLKPILVWLGRTLLGWILAMLILKLVIRLFLMV